MKHPHLTIGDLIHVPEVQTVIRLEQGKTNPADIAGSFVFTREVTSHFTVITESLLKNKGQGYFLQGDFGSGKSHFLACLYSALEFGNSIEYLSHSHGGIKRIIEADMKLLPVTISLIKYRARTSLEQIVIHSIETAFLEHGIETHLTPLSHFLDWLKKLLIDPVHADAFSKEFTPGNKDLHSWIDEHPKDAYRSGMIFLRNQGLPAPELLVEERHETFGHVLGALNTYGFKGLFLIIDELSEFFRSKPDSHSLNEDARTLQYLGEMSQEKPVWIIAAVQESIEKTGDITQGTFRKIKDRFPVKLVLSTLHIRSLISGRLVKPKPQTDETLYSLYEEYTKQFTTFTLSYNEFKEIYPVHPATISLIDGLSDLFSVHRGIVDFVHSQIAGDEQRNIKGILHRPAMELLAPDSIFDHFETRISEFSDFYIYPRHILPHLKEVIEKEIEEPKDREVALRIMKILILYKIHPTAREPAVKELTELVACALFFQNPDMNVRFIVEGILDPIVAASRFLIKEPSPSDNPLEAVYTIVKEDNPGKLLKSRITAKASELSENDSRLLSIPLSELRESTAWPGPEIMEPGIQQTVEWLHSSRKVFVRFIIDPDTKALDRFFYDLRESKSDFGVLFTPSEKEITGEHLAVWEIPFQQMDTALYTEYIATKLVAESLSPKNPADAPLINLAQEKYTRMKPLVHNSLIDLIYSGKFRDSEIDTHPVIRQIKYFDKITEIAGNVVLDRRYPEFKRISPRRTSPTYRNYQRLLDEFVIPGSILIRDARAKGLDDGINGLAAPLGLVELKAGSYLFSPDFTEYPLLSTFFSLLKASTHTPAQEVRDALGSGDYGVPENMFFFLITALASAGLISLLRSGRTMPVDSLSLVSVQKADAIAPGELISKSDRETLINECGFLVPQVSLESFGLTAQREVWKSTIKFKETIQTLIAGVSEMVHHYGGYSAFLTFDQKSIEKKARDFTYIADEIKKSYSAKEGLEGFLSAWRGSGLRGEDVEFLKKFHRFIKFQAKSFVFIHHYINHPEVEKAAQTDRECMKLKQMVTALMKKPELSIVEDEGKHLGNVFEHFRDHYARVYTDNHNHYYTSFEKKKLSKYARRALQTITALSGIESLDRPPGLSSFLHTLDRNSTPVCKKRPTEELQSSPFCSCGYRLGMEPDPGEDAPEAAIEKMLFAYVDIMSSPKICESLTAWAYAHHDKDPSMAEQLDSFCRTLKNNNLTPSSLLDLLGEAVITNLKKALAGKVKIKQIHPGELMSRLAGRRLPADRITSIVSDWLGPDDENTIFGIEGDISSMVQDSQISVAWWPLLHRDIFTTDQAPASAYELQNNHLETVLEKTYPASQLRKKLETLETRTLIRFALEELFHYHAIFKAWQIVCDRVLGGEQWPGEVPVRSHFTDPKKSEEIAHAFSILSEMYRCKELSFPGQLKARLFIEELSTHPHSTHELKNSAFAWMEKWEQLCEEWGKTLDPVPQIHLEENPVVIICDGVSVDVWLKAIHGNHLFQKADVSAFSRLTAPSNTVDALTSLFGFSGDPYDEFHKRDVHYFTIKGDEEHTLPHPLLPLPKGPVVLRLNSIDRAGHEGRLGLYGMAENFKTICETGIPPLRELCDKEKRKLILTVDHGFTLQKNGLTHGGGGIFERIIPRVEWGESATR